ncbi:hypothetical protein SAMN02745174_02352 [Cetobacterium ceti]|uniref:Uncharacterized protein n=1 Tax=Cetobacterium ceti TaxID=180163 RepID=A0A1T4QJZ1_9FUSO|nr:hypothetical protein [Cetobacterium ceti]SKA03976.1 hypothetical protein SAMN02745174_02352 [Cetobacterium ceti]
MINRNSMYQELYQWTLQNANKYLFIIIIFLLIIMFVLFKYRKTIKQYEFILSFFMILGLILICAYLIFYAWNITGVLI